ncbi:MAG: hypothetical protein Q4G16_11730 [Cruoricaptor ignavus]|nr:hypothetical protein [Cruoricaptor ignavus]
MILILLIFCSCIDSKKIKAEKIIGNWNIERNAYSKGNLDITENKTFSFSETSHLNETYANGNWEIINDTLILTSKMPNECLYVNNFAQYCEDKYIVVKLFFETTIEHCEPKNITKNFTKFDNEKFVIKSDSLIYISTNKNCANEQFEYKINK